MKNELFYAAVMDNINVMRGTYEVNKQVNIRIREELSTALSSLNSSVEVLTQTVAVIQMKKR